MSALIYNALVIYASKIISNLEYFKYLFSPSSYLSDKYLDLLTREIEDLYSFDSEGHRVYLTENGRCAQYLALSSLGLKKGSKVAVQPFTCNSAVIPVLWNQLDLVYIDIDKQTLNMDPDLLEKELRNNPDIEAVIVQHTFGRTADLGKILSLAEEYKLYVLEDCAHALGVEHEGEMLGTFGDTAIISFGLEKNLPTKVGGALLVNNLDLIDKVADSYQSYRYTSLWRSFLWFMNPPLRILSRRLGQSGKDVLNFLIGIGLFEVGSTEGELHGEMPGYYPARLSRLLGRVVYGHFNNLNKLLQKRVDDSSFYIDSLGVGKVGSRLPGGAKNVPYVKFPYFCTSISERDKLQNYLTSKGHYITDWYHNQIYPKGTNLDAMQYTPGQAPNAERANETILNLPTGNAFLPSIVDDIKEFYESR